MTADICRDRIHDTAPLILLAAGGTGGHLFPAEALGVELIRRGLRVRLATDSRALRYSGLFSKDTIDVVPSETVRGRTPWSLAHTGMMLAAGTAVALNLMRRLKPAAVVGFGGYPTVPPLMAAGCSACPASFTTPMRCSAAPTVFCRAASARSRPRCPACSIAIRQLAAKTTTVGTPMRPAILAAAAVKFVVARTERAAAPAGGRRQPGRARDGRYRARRDRAAGAGAVEPAGPDPAGARRRHGAGARGL